MNVCSDRNRFLRFCLPKGRRRRLTESSMHWIHYNDCRYYYFAEHCVIKTFAINILMYTNDWTAAIFRFRFLSIYKFKQFFFLGWKTLQYFFCVFLFLTSWNHINMFHFLHTFRTYLCWNWTKKNLLTPCFHTIFSVYVTFGLDCEDYRNKYK